MKVRRLVILFISLLLISFVSVRCQVSVDSSATDDDGVEPSNTEVMQDDDSNQNSNSNAEESTVNQSKESSKHQDRDPESDAMTNQNSDYSEKEADERKIASTEVNQDSKIQKNAESQDQNGNSIDQKDEKEDENVVILLKQPANDDETEDEFEDENYGDAETEPEIYHQIEQEYIEPENDEGQANQNEENRDTSPKSEEELESFTDNALNTNSAGQNLEKEEEKPINSDLSAEKDQNDIEENSSGNTNQLNNEIDRHKSGTNEDSKEAENGQDQSSEVLDSLDNDINIDQFDAPPYLEDEGAAENATQENHLAEDSEADAIEKNQDSRSQHANLSESMSSKSNPDVHSVTQEEDPEPSTNETPQNTAIDSKIKNEDIIKENNSENTEKNSANITKSHHQTSESEFNNRDAAQTHPSSHSPKHDPQKPLETSTIVQNEPKDQEPDPLSLDILEDLVDYEDPEEPQPHSPQNEEISVEKQNVQSNPKPEVQSIPELQSESSPNTNKATLEQHLQSESPQVEETGQRNLEDNIKNSFISQTNNWFSPTFQSKAKIFHKYQEQLFVKFIVPLYNRIKKSALCTAILFFVILVYVTKKMKGFFALLFGGSSKHENRGNPIPVNEIIQQLTEFSKELESLKNNLPQQKGGVKLAPIGLDPQKINNVAQRLTQSEESLSKLFRDNKQLNAYLGNFQKEIVDSHKEIWKELNALRTATKTIKTDNMITDSRESRSRESGTRGSNDP